jgi:hypothetical protein
LHYGIEEGTAVLEKRSAPRMRQLKQGRIIFNQRRSVMSCVIRNCTATGALVSVGEAHIVPAQFEISIGGGEPRKAHRVWVKASEIGLKFDS